MVSLLGTPHYWCEVYVVSAHAQMGAGLLKTCLFDAWEMAQVPGLLHQHTVLAPQSPVYLVCSLAMEHPPCTGTPSPWLCHLLKKGGWLAPVRALVYLRGLPDVHVRESCSFANIVCAPAGSCKNYAKYFTHCPARTGYALSIYLPISLICIAPSDIARWLIVMIGTATSGLFLFMNLRERILAAGPGK